MSKSLENRVAQIERELALLKSQVPGMKANWIAEITGLFKDDPDFDEIVRLGQEMRDAEKSEDEK